MPGWPPETDITIVLSVLSGFRNLSLRQTDPVLWQHGQPSAAENPSLAHARWIFPSLSEEWTDTDPEPRFAASAMTALTRRSAASSGAPSDTRRPSILHSEPSLYITDPTSRSPSMATRRLHPPEMPTLPSLTILTMSGESIPDA